MNRRIFIGGMAAVVPLGALTIPATPAYSINVVGSPTVANTAAYGTVVVALQLRNAAGALVSGASWTVTNPRFYTDFFGDLHTSWETIIAPGPQAMTITAMLNGAVVATLPLTVAITGTLAPQTMVLTPSQIVALTAESVPNTIAYSLTTSQTDGTLGNLEFGVAWTCDNPNFAVVNTNTDAGIYYLWTTGTLPVSTQIVNLTASEPGYMTAELALSIPVSP